MSDRIYRKKDGGTWYGWFYTADRRRVVACLRTCDRKLAVRRLREVERQHDAQGGPSTHTSSDSTLRDALEYLIQHGCSECAAATVSSYAQKAGHLLRLLGECHLGRLTRDDVQRYINERLAEGAVHHTVHKELVVLRRALLEARERGILREHPATLIPKFRPRYRPRRTHLSREEVAAVVETLPPRRREWVWLAVFTGGRCGEIEGLTWEHVDLAERRLMLPGTKTAAAERFIPIAEPLAALLDDMSPKHGPVVAAWPNVRRDLGAACTRAGVKRVSPNDLRRTFATWLKKQGVDSMAVARLLGHKSTRMVELVYGHLDDEDLRRAIAKLPDVRSGPGTLLRGDATGLGSAPTLHDAGSTIAGRADGDIVTCSSRRDPANVVHLLQESQRRAGARARLSRGTR